MDYQSFFAASLARLKEEGNYRHFAHIERLAGDFPHAHIHNSTHIKTSPPPQNVTVWCSNDYLGMGQHPTVIKAMQDSLSKQGSGAGGTRNISGTNYFHVALEERLAQLHNKQSALIFTSGYVANLTSLSVLGRHLPDILIFSDEKNHNSMIEGVRHSRAQKVIFKHNDAQDLEEKLNAAPHDQAKLIAFESVYSMDADIGPIKDFVALAKKYNALTYLDEVHAVGMYGSHGAGIARRENIDDEVDIIQGTLGKAFGVIGGYIASDRDLIDFVRSFGHGFIFTTALPPAIAAGALASIDIVSSQEGDILRERQQQAAQNLKQRLQEAGLPLMQSDCHIVPILVGDAIKCRMACEQLMQRYGIYVQPINYPTVEYGKERLRLTPTPYHTEKDIDHLITALKNIWNDLNL